MNCTINLLPESCHNARRRVLRRNAWSAIVIAAALLLVGAGTTLRATGQSIHRLNRELAGLKAKQSELNRRLTLALRLRNDLARRARALSALRQEQPLPQQLLTLAREAPAGVVFTEIQSLRSGGARSTTRRPPRTARPASTASAVTTTNEPSSGIFPGSAGSPPALQFSGYAVDHDELTRLIDTLQRISHWEHAELLRAAREPYLSGTALAFRLESRPAETSQ